MRECVGEGERGRGRGGMLTFKCDCAVAAYRGNVQSRCAWYILSVCVCACVCVCVCVRERERRKKER
jgi:hypothetical protein